MNAIAAVGRATPTPSPAPEVVRPGAPHTQFGALSQAAGVPWSTLAVIYSRFEWFKDSAVETDPQVPEDAPDTLCEEEIEICPDLSDPLSREVFDGLFRAGHQDKSPVSFKSFARGLLLLEKGPTPSVLAAMAGIVLGVAEDTEQDVTLDQFVDGVRRFSAMSVEDAEAVFYAILDHSLAVHGSSPTPSPAPTPEPGEPPPPPRPYDGRRPGQDTDEESRIYVEHVVEFLLDVVSEEGLQRVLVLGIGGAPSP